MKKAKTNIEQSEKWLSRAAKVIPSCTQTFSKGPTQFVQGVAPIYLERGSGSHVWDVDGNEYIDYVLGLGCVILGYAYPRVNEAITRQLEKGIAFTLMHPLEVEVAELIVKHNLSAEMVRFGKNGSDATTGAVRIARAYTGREKVACAGYHGWHDWFIVSTTRNLGVPKFNRELVKCFSYNDIDGLKRIFEENPTEIAAVILEPSTFDEPKGGFLSGVKELTRKHGALLIFDEVVTGFKIGMSGAQGYYEVIPDLTCLGKSIANGMPLSAIAGKREIMEVFDRAFYSFTFGGETLSLAAAQATLLELEEKNVHAHLWKLGASLKDGYNRLVEESDLIDYTRCAGLPPRTLVRWYEPGKKGDSLLLKSVFQQECLKRGVLYTGVQHVCFSHTEEDIAKTLDAYGEGLAVIKKGVQQGNIEKCLEGKMVEPVFRKLD